MTWVCIEGCRCAGERDANTCGCTQCGAVLHGMDVRWDSWSPSDVLQCRCVQLRVIFDVHCSVSYGLHSYKRWTAMVVSVECLWPRWLCREQQMLHGSQDSYQFISEDLFRCIWAQCNSAWFFHHAVWSLPQISSPCAYSSCSAHLHNEDI